MRKTIAFDVYGTLIDAHGVVALLQTYIGEQAAEFSNLWRDKQLEYSFRRAVMQRYQDFTVCTQDALLYACKKLNTTLSEEQIQSLMDAYKTLPAFSDAASGLYALKEEFYLVAFSNGDRVSIEGLLTHAGLMDLFDDIITADEIETFKPDPQIYQHLLTRTQSIARKTWLVSSNPFDVIGARAQSMKAAWVKRDDSAIFDNWELEPNAVIQSLEELNTLFEK